MASISCSLGSTSFFTIGQAGATSSAGPGFSGRLKMNSSESQHAETAPVELILTEPGDCLFIERLGADHRSFIEKISLDGQTCICYTNSGRRK